MRGICRNLAFSSHFSRRNSIRFMVARFFRRPFFRFPGSFSGLGSLEFRSLSGGFRSLCRVFVRLVYIIRSFVQFVLVLFVQVSDVQKKTQKAFSLTSFQKIIDDLELNIAEIFKILLSRCEVFNTRFIWVFN